jgi:hypothetical protein
VVLIIDGFFHVVPPVRHKEILYLLAEGVVMGGAASMGALRAAELYPYGMHGVGQIFEMYKTGVIDGDDEVAIIHASDDVRAISIALVDIRYFLDEATRRGLVCENDRARILEIVKSIPYQARSAANLIKTVNGCASISKAASLWWAGVNGISTCPSLKYLDALELLTATASGRLVPSDTSSWENAPWRTSQLSEWISRFRSRKLNTERVPFAAEIQHQRLYDPSFPGRWRTCILTWMAGLGVCDDSAFIEARAIEVARARGLALELLDDAQIDYWLTASEKMIAHEEQILRLLIRSSRSETLGNQKFLETAKMVGLLNPQIDSASAVLSAWRTNEAVVRSDPRKSVYRIRSELLAAHLAECWGVQGGNVDDFEAAARDRGFGNADGAIEASRGFYLFESGILGDQFTPEAPSATL